MMDLSTPEANQLYGLLLLGAPIGLLTERTIHVAMIKASGRTNVKGFVGRDSVVFLTTLMASLTALLPATMTYGVGDVVDFLASVREEISLLGWAMTILVMVHVFAPFVVALCLLRGRQQRLNREVATPSQNTQRVEPFFIALCMLLLWIVGGSIALMFSDSYSASAAGHGLTIWLMGAFALLGSVYFLIARMGGGYLASRVVIFLIAVIEVILGVSYFSW